MVNVSHSKVILCIQVKIEVQYRDCTKSNRGARTCYDTSTYLCWHIDVYSMSVSLFIFMQSL